MLHTDPAKLRSAFLKIAWSPLVAIIGAVVIGAVSAALAVTAIMDTPSLMADTHDVFSVAEFKYFSMAGAAVNLAAYYLSYRGFSDAHKEFGFSPAGKGFATIKLIFVIFMILSVLSLIFVLFCPDSIDVMAHTKRHMAAATGTFGIISLAIYALNGVFSIAAMFIIRSRMRTIADNCNIASLQHAATGATIGLYSICAMIVIVFLAAFAGNEVFFGIIELMLLAAVVVALVKWEMGWFGAASEVRTHPVEYTEE